MRLFRLDTSIRTDGSVSRELGDTVESTWRAEHPGGSVVRRDVGTSPVSVSSWIDAVGAGPVDVAARTAQQHDAVALAVALADEVLDADAILIATQLYNFGVPAQLKTWFDLLLTDPRVSPGGQPALAGRPAVLVVARGGGYGAGTPREGWDHATPWVRRILVDVLGVDLHVVEAELTLAGVNPALDAFRGLAEQSRLDAEVAAVSHGRTIASLARASAA
ncbi:MAG: Acyl carrier protein phosphodiesterase [Frankiales bacterium]|jgi:FMN-dependent NADH-azoreductase|nr:Acyl carrier protein phosphodiesterase [Frankiales bacterium]